MNHVDKQKGFTLIELMLAMTFISFLLLAIAMTVIQVGAIYGKGMTLKEVNQSGREISTDIRRNVASKDAINLATDYVEVTNNGLKTGGRLCLGSTSFLWNYGEALQTSNSALITHANGDTIRMAKVSDPNKKYCARDANGRLLSTIPAAERSLVSELLRPGDRTLELYQLSIISENAASDTATGQRLYTISFTLGSGKYTALNDTKTLCKGPGEPDADPQYCAVEEFNLVIRAGNRVN